MVGVNYGPVERRTVGDGHRERVGHQRGGSTGIDRPPHDAARERIQDNRAEHLTFASAVFGDVVDLQPIWLFTGEHPVDQVAGCRGLVSRFRPSGPGQAFDAGARHHGLDLVVSDGQAESEGELGVNAPGAVCAARCGMHGFVYSLGKV